MCRASCERCDVCFFRSFRTLRAPPGRPAGGAAGSVRTSRTRSPTGRWEEAGGPSFLRSSLRTREPVFVPGSAWDAPWTAAVKWEAVARDPRTSLLALLPQLPPAPQQALQEPLRRMPAGAPRSRTPTCFSSAPQICTLRSTPPAPQPTADACLTWTASLQAQRGAPSLGTAAGHTRPPGCWCRTPPSTSTE